MNKAGIVYFVGAGPGDPKLITVRGLECIREADVLIYDRLANPELLRHAKEDSEKIYCGKLPDHHTLRQEELNELILAYARAGKVVVRLKGGDPGVFGRVGEEAEHCRRHGIPYEIVPGITAGLAAPLYAGIPVTHRELGQSFACVTGHTARGELSAKRWQALATGIDTVIFYMGVKNLPDIVDRLIEYGRSPDSPAAIIEWGTLADQRVLAAPLNQLVTEARQADVRNPSIIIVGEVASLYPTLSWFTADDFVKKELQSTKNEVK
ncbi:uroporphyrinogen-III C-methyltransferase [Halalkalibacter oceani]|uniref:uroporphyrinogen-III C-methyltransferase n=1 Tax=Halalkalibacter oceani TaxID=1653776 RepID=UPI00339118D4